MGSRHSVCKKCPRVPTHQFLVTMNHPYTNTAIIYFPLGPLQCHGQMFSALSACSIPPGLDYDS